LSIDYLFISRINIKRDKTASHRIEIIDMLKLQRSTPGNKYERKSIRKDFSLINKVDTMIKTNFQNANEIANEVFLVSPQIHGGLLAFWGSVVPLLRFEPVTKTMESLLLLLPVAAKQDASIIEPVCFENWICHFIVLALSIELATGFYSLMHRSKDSREKKLYRGLFAVYALSFIQSNFAMWSHTLIGVNTKLENLLYNYFKAFIKTGIFGTGCAVTLGPWSLIATFVGVLLQKIDFTNWTGRFLATFTLATYCRKELPNRFKISYFSLLLMPLFIGILPEYSELAHTVATALLCVIFSQMVLSLNRKILADSI